MSADDNPTNPTFGSTMENETLLWALEHLAHSHGTTYAPATLRAATEEARRNSPGPFSKVWQQRLSAAANVAGLSIT